MKVPQIPVTNVSPDYTVMLNRDHTAITVAVRPPGLIEMDSTSARLMARYLNSHADTLDEIERERRNKKDALKIRRQLNGQVYNVRDSRVITEGEQYLILHEGGGEMWIMAKYCDVVEEAD